MESGWPFRSDDQPDASHKPTSERKSVRWHARNRGQPRRAGFGRRRTDYDPRSTVTAKVIAGIVFIVNALYLVGEAILHQDICP